MIKIMIAWFLIKYPLNPPQSGNEAKKNEENTSDSLNIEHIKHTPYICSVKYEI